MWSQRRSFSRSLLAKKGESLLISRVSQSLKDSISCELAEGMARPLLKLVALALFKSKDQLTALRTV